MTLSHLLRLWPTVRGTSFAPLKLKLVSCVDSSIVDYCVNLNRCQALTRSLSRVEGTLGRPASHSCTVSSFLHSFIASRSSLFPSASGAKESGSEGGKCWICSARSSSPRFHKQSRTFRTAMIKHKVTSRGYAAAVRPSNPVLGLTGSS